jgi:transposase
VITIGIDPHKASLTAVAVDASGTPLGQRRLLVNAGTLSQLVTWAAAWPSRRFAVEGAGGLGQPIAQQLAAAGEHVLDVPATLASRARLLGTGGGRKTDATDAASVAQVALHCPRLRTVTAEDQTTILRLLAKRRQDLAGERTRILNRLHGLLRDLLPGGAPTDLSADKAAALLRGVRPATATAACRPTAGPRPARRPATRRRTPQRQQDPSPRRPGRHRHHPHRHTRPGCRAGRQDPRPCRRHHPVS